MSVALEPEWPETLSPREDSRSRVAVQTKDGRAYLKAQRSRNNVTAANTAKRNAVGAMSTSGAMTTHATQSSRTTHITLSNDRCIAVILGDFARDVKREGWKRIPALQ